MAASRTCRVCSAELHLLHPGGASQLTSEELVPTNHRPGEHGDLWECDACGTVHQPELPSGSDLHDLYRAMADSAYLSEEEGRRATARRLLDLIGRRVEAGSLLEIGCGHGLLLDEARRRGYATTGVELSADAAGYARDVLGLDIRELAFEQFAQEREPESFDVIVLADVIEHFDDPVAVLDACERLLAPGGVLCVVTPDPSSRVARIAGSRWWAFIPAHTVLIPRGTLIELLGARGLVIADDDSLVRSFRFGYWLSGLAERGGFVAGAANALARTPAGDRTLSLSLGDETVLLASKAPVVEPSRALVAPRGGRSRVHVVIPAYAAAETISKLASRMPVEALDHALLIDDASPDRTSDAALQEGFAVLRHPVARGYGASQKSSFVCALQAGADVIVTLGAENQYDPALVAQLAKPIEEGIADVVIASRVLEDAERAGVIPRWRRLGNEALTALENAGFRRNHSEYHTGLRAYSADVLRSVAFLRNSDELVFDQELFAQLTSRGARVAEVVIPARHLIAASRVPLGQSIVYGLKTLGVVARYRLDERRGRWPLLRPPAGAIRGAERSGRTQV